MIRMLERDDIPTVLLKGRAMHEESPVFNPSKYDDKKVEALLIQSLEDNYNVCVVVAAGSSLWHLRNFTALNEPPLI